MFGLGQYEKLCSLHEHSMEMFVLALPLSLVQEQALFLDQHLPQLLDLLKRPEYSYRYWAKREIREMKPITVKKALDQWVKDLDPNDPRHRHHQVEAIWAYRNVEQSNIHLLSELLRC